MNIGSPEWMQGYVDSGTLQFPRMPDDVYYMLGWNYRKYGP